MIYLIQVIFILGFISTCVQSDASTALHGPDVYHSGPHYGYYGSYVGSFIPHSHSVNGDLYVADMRRIIVKDFNYDGTGPDPIFLAGDKRGARHILTEVRGRGQNPFHGKFIDQDVILEIPHNLDMSAIKWVSVFASKTGKSYGDVEFPYDYQIPGQVVIGPLGETRQRNWASTGYIRVLDAQTFLIPEFNYDGASSGVYWWATRGSRQSPAGQRLLNEVGSDSQLGRYKGQDVIIALPDNGTIYDYDWLGLWCADFHIDFGHVKIPQDIRVPPSSRMFENLSPTLKETRPIPSGPSVSGIREAHRSVYYETYTSAHSHSHSNYRSPPTPPKSSLIRSPSILSSVDSPYPITTSRLKPHNYNQMKTKSKSSSRHPLPLPLADDNDVGYSPSKYRYLEELKTYKRPPPPPKYREYPRNIDEIRDQQRRRRIYTTSTRLRDSYDDYKK